MATGLVQLIRIEESTGKIWVKLLFLNLILVNWVNPFVRISGLFLLHIFMFCYGGVGDHKNPVFNTNTVTSASTELAKIPVLGH